MTGSRRSFLQAAGVAASSARILGANDRIRLGAIGVGGRGSYLVELARKLKGVELVAFADVYQPRLAEARRKFAPEAREYPAYLALLDQKDVDAVIIGAPDHWHARMTTDAVSAGKDVYVEKPLTHAPEEGAPLEQAVRASGRIVQVGYQQRSWPHFFQAREVFASGVLGKLALVLVSWNQNYAALDERAVAIDPSALDWKAFLGSAREQPFNALRYRHWRWFWDFGGGHLTDLYSHFCDVLHWYTGEGTPLAAQAMGQNNVLPRFECPDTIAASYVYPGGYLVAYHGTLSGSLGGGNIILRGTKATMRLNRDGFDVYAEGMVPFENTSMPEPVIAARSTGDGTPAHIRNFLDSVRARRTPNAPVGPALAAANAAHMANAALRAGARVQSRPAN